MSTGETAPTVPLLRAMCAPDPTIEPPPPSLPAALRPWARELAAFPLELALALGPALRRLHVALGPLREADAGLGDPDGVADLSRHGSYERLVAGEWLLLDEAPDEFLRRAAMQEHLFLARAHRAPRAGRRAVVLFDAGPEQLGAPRLVHLAALVELARRAAAASARFSFGTLQAPGRLRSAIDPASIRALLEARTVHPPEPSDLADWRAALALAPEDELVLVGSHALMRMNASITLAIREPLGPGTRTLDLSLRQPAGTAQLSLDLPAPDAAIRLLRDPFASAVQPPSREPLAETPTSLLLSHTGRHLFGRTGNDLVVIPVPGSPRERPGRVRRVRIPPGHEAHAIGWHRGHVRVLVHHVSSDVWILLGHGTTTAGFDRPATEVTGMDAAWVETLGVEKEALDGRLSPLLFTANGTAAVLLYPGGLVRISLSGGCRLDRGVYDRRFVALFATQRTTYALFRPPAGAPNQARPSFLASVSGDLERLEAVTLTLEGGGRGFATHRGDRFATALERDPTTWQVQVFPWPAADIPSHVLLCPSEGARVVGVRLDDDAEPALLTLEADQRTLTLLGRRQSRTLHVAPAPIEEITTSETQPEVAYRTAAGDLLVVRTTDGATLLHHRITTVAVQ